MADLPSWFSVAENNPKHPDFIETDIVLVGGGHTHVQVLKSFGMNPRPGVRLTLIAKELNAPYSGMLPGLIAGHYGFEDCHIDLVRLAQFAGARIIHGSVNGIDRVAKCVSVTDRPPVRYDIASIDVGITPDLSNIQGANEYGIAVKPISTFWPKWQALERRVQRANGPRRITIVGGGAAGCELALAVDHRLRKLLSQDRTDAANLTITLVTGGMLLPRHNARARRLALKALSDRKIHVADCGRATELTAKCVTLDTGLVIPTDAALITTGAAAPDWFAKTDLSTTDAGYIAIRKTLQMHGDDHIFAVGDCASSQTTPREKSGVFAVRQGPTLIKNLGRVTHSKAAKAFAPQKYFLTLLSLANGRAIASKGTFAASGRWAWTLKDHIDQKFMRNFNALPKMSESDDSTAEMRCGGCAAKVGPVTLSNALQRLGLESANAPEDAAVIDEGGPTLKLQSLDFFRAFWPDPFVLGEIAANHALNDIYAMSGIPDGVLALAVLPFGKAHIVEEDLYQLLAGARVVFDRENVKLAGGHSGEGLELAIGFSVSGQVPRDDITKKIGLKIGDQLVLTKPIGTGITFAAHMQGDARAQTIATALKVMRQSNRVAAGIIKDHSPSAITDITGFGLAGHIIEMLQASHVSADLDLSQIPVFPGALDLAQLGHASSLLEQNMSLVKHVAQSENLSPISAALLFDPQTSGGLLAGVEEDSAPSCVRELREAGYGAAVIGRVTETSIAKLSINGVFSTPQPENKESYENFRDQEPHRTCGDKSYYDLRTAR